MLDSFFSTLSVAQVCISFALITAIAAIIYSFIAFQWIQQQPAGNQQMQAIALAISKWAKVF